MNKRSKSKAPKFAAMLDVTDSAEAWVAKHGEMALSAAAATGNVDLVERIAAHNQGVTVEEYRAAQDKLFGSHMSQADLID